MARLDEKQHQLITLKALHERKLEDELCVLQGFQAQQSLTSNHSAASLGRTPPGSEPQEPGEHARERPLLSSRPDVAQATFCPNHPYSPNSRDAPELGGHMGAPGLPQSHSQAGLRLSSSSSRPVTASSRPITATSRPRTPNVSQLMRKPDQDEAPVEARDASRAGSRSKSGQSELQVSWRSHPHK